MYDPKELGSFGPAQFNPQEMGDLQGMDTQKTLDIIMSSAKKEQPDLDEEEFKQQLATALNANEMFLLRIVNTVFILRPTGETSVEFHVATIEDPNTLMDRMQAGAKALKGFGYEHVTSYSDNPAFVRLAKMMAQGGGFVRPTVEQLDNGVYKFEADL
jgi:hypothetical protein